MFFMMEHFPNHAIKSVLTALVKQTEENNEENDKVNV